MILREFLPTVPNLVDKLIEGFVKLNLCGFGSLRPEVEGKFEVDEHILLFFSFLLNCVYR